jgi:hypothetical protein
VRISVGVTSKPVENITQAILYTSQGRKMDDLVEELKTREGSVLIFGRTQHRVDRMSKTLKDKGFTNARIHGGRTQGQRKISLDQFKHGSVRILVATDIAARGLDINHIAHVVNFDLPMVAEDYIHRIGRTARAGAKGDSLSFITPDDRNLWKDILRTLGSASANVVTLPSHFKDHPTPLAKPAAIRTNLGTANLKGRVLQVLIPRGLIPATGTSVPPSVIVVIPPVPAKTATATRSTAVVLPRAITVARTARDIVRIVPSARETARLLPRSRVGLKRCSDGSGGFVF